MVQKVSITILVIAIITILGIYFMGLPFNVDFADKVYLKFHYGETEIDCEITDKNDISELKRLLKTHSYSEKVGGTPACGGFYYKVSLTFQNENEKVMVCPGGDTCGSFRIGESDRYFALDDEDKEKFYSIVKKYGMTFPCI